MNIVDIDEKLRTLIRNMRDNVNKIVYSDPKVIDAIHVIRMALSQ